VSADPYPAYAAWREAGPIHWSDDFFGGAWVLARHADVDAVLRDDRRFSARRTGGWVGQGEQQRGELRAFQALFARAMLFVDGQDHARLRQVLNAGFRPAALQALAPRIEARVRERLDAVDAAAGFDFMHAVAGPLPAEVIAMLMGIGEPDHERFATWTEDLAAFIGAMTPAPELARRAQRSLLEMSAFFAALLRERRHAPGDGLVGLLLQAGQQGKVEEGAELLSQCAMLLFAGHETTRNLLGNGLLALLQHPAQWQLLCRQPQRVGDAVRELLRFDSPVQYTGRRVAQDLELHGRRLRRGDLVVALIGAANRDPRRYDDPDRLDVTRKAGGLLSFGRGAHVCIGAVLTQIEAEAVLRQLLARWPRLGLADEAVCWNGNAVYRGLRALWVREAQSLSTAAAKR
jgi:cytochrome P450